jgi:hypothetical protein
MKRDLGCAGFGNGFQFGTQKIAAQKIICYDQAAVEDSL